MIWIRCLTRKPSKFETSTLFFWDSFDHINIQTRPVIPHRTVWESFYSSERSEDQSYLSISFLSSMLPTAQSETDLIFPKQEHAD